MPSAGALICLASAVAFGAMAIFGKLAYDEGATVGTLLAVRFSLAAALFWALVACHGRRAPPARALAAATSASRSRSARVGYSAQAGAYFAALQRLDAALLSLLLYTFPAMVTVAAIALGRERASRRTAGALVARVGRPVPRPGRGRRRGARSARHAAGGRGRRRSTASTSSPRRASPSGSARSS